MMYQLLCLVIGFVLAVMITVNGNLSGQYSAFTAAVIIHAVGSLAAMILCALQKKKTALWIHKPRWIYLGGAIGVFTTVFQNLAFGRISITSVIALGLLGQTVTSLVIDRFGLFGMKKRPFHLNTFIGLAFSMLGIGMMMDMSAAAAAMAVILSFSSGISMVLSRTVNARLAEQTGALRGSLVNHLVGLPITIVVAVMVSGGAPSAASSGGAVPLWIYFGGVLGVAVIMMLNMAVPRVPAFQLTMLMFVGQAFTGILLDVLVGGGFSDRSFWGGIVIAAGMVIYMITDQANASKERKV